MSYGSESIHCPYESIGVHCATDCRVAHCLAGGLKQLSLDRLCKKTVDVFSRVTCVCICDPR